MKTKKKYLSQIELKRKGMYYKQQWRDKNFGIYIKKIKGEKCCALDSDGKRCKDKAVVECYYFGDLESEYVDWVRVTFCDYHAQKY